MRHSQRILVSLPSVISSGTLATHRLRNKYLSLLEESAIAIHNSGIYTCKFRAEFGLAQFEVVTGPLPPMGPSTTRTNVGGFLFGQGSTGMLGYGEQDHASSTDQIRI
jgi:hypothetical protein